ncbi:hypothetical protein K490DRAFT_56738 [Saccharata proteae CBS 121410]|uniref:Uncharacterized protein n=1 Tax=Saccharata proteae CBS 121410 TaxID=1314787 RepID=A0A9P4M081_9PEZI|nr:hypothetical protein K490DRAFT_56738 [Saccharata proteae CBS 121410]
MSWASAIVRDLLLGGQEWWGFMVYRTVYGNDDEWKEFRSACNELCENAFAAPDGQVEEADSIEAREKLRLELVEDPALDGMDSDGVLDLFRQHCSTSDWSAGARGRNQVCLMANADVVHSVLAARRGEKDVTPYLLAIDRNYDHGVKNTDYDSQNSDYAPNARENDGIDPDDDEDEGDDGDEPIVLKVKMKDIISEFYINLLCDVQPEEMTGLSYVL